MRVVLYSQHVLGVGHVFRVLEIARALYGHEVYLITGGPEVRVPLPEHVTHLPLPGLRMDENFSGLFTVDAGRSLDGVKAERLAAIRGHLQKISPHALVIELFPFGRKAFKFELLPILEEIRSGGLGGPKVVCSLRDILVEKSDPDKYEKRALKWLNRLFDALMVHSDPSLIPLDHTFSRVDQIEAPLIYTGYVTPKPDPAAGKSLRAELGLDPTELLVVASAGGGGVGRELPRAALEASEILQKRVPHRFFAFTGPYADPYEFERMQKRASRLDRARVERFTDRFLDYLCASRLSLSLAGYNTTLNILSAGVYGLVLPFDQNREQRMRSECLARRGALGVLEPKDLEPGSLARRMEKAFMLPRPQAHGLNLDGAANTALELERLVGAGR